VNSVQDSNSQLLAVHPVLMASDVRRSIRFFEELGFTTSFLDDQHNPRYAGLTRNDVEIHLQWNELPSTEKGGDCGWCADGDPPRSAPIDHLPSSCFCQFKIDQARQLNFDQGLKPVF
jgi:catechol 2,3-dioxygenase-like lactoylglutathione lyase family enzyme